MSVVPARCLMSHALSMLSRNIVAAANADRQSRPPKPPEPSEPPKPPASGASAASFSTADDEPIEPEPFESVIDQALRSQHVAG